MKQKQWAVMWIVGAVLLSGCDLGVGTGILPGPGTGRIPAPGGVFTLAYTAYRESGSVAVTGTIRLTRTDSEHVEGTWELRAIGDPAGLGPQTGTGNAVGSVSDTSIVLNLNPDYADNNVFVYGSRFGNEFFGTWEWVGFPGVLTRGPFRAAIR